MTALFRHVGFVAIISSCGLSGLCAQPSSLEERLKNLEREVADLRNENGQLRSALGMDGKDLAAAVKPGGREPFLSVGGFVQAQFDFGDKGDARFTTGNDRFYLRRARLIFTGRWSDDFDFRVGGEFAGSLAETTGNRMQMTDAYIDWTRFTFASVRIGQFNTPFGFEQLASDARLLSIERSLVNDRLTFNRQIGLQVGGDFFGKNASYAVGMFNGNGTNTSANDNEKFLWAGRLSAILFQGRWQGQDTKWTVGANGAKSNDTNLNGQPVEFGFDLIPGGAKDNVFTGRRRVGGLDTQLHAGLADLSIEYLRERFEPTSQVPANHFETAGWYAQATYFVVPKQLQAVAKYEVFDPNLSSTHDVTRTWTLGGNWFLKGDDLKLQLNYLLSQIESISRQHEAKLILRLQTIY